jgi:hypothetical protein
VGSVRGENVGVVMVTLNGHEAGNGGYSQGRPTARQVLLYSERCPITAAFIRLEDHLRLARDLGATRAAALNVMRALLRIAGLSGK